MRLDESALVQWGVRIGETIATPAFIALSGGLGAGKSVLARGIGSGAGVTVQMPSPSFTLVNRYSGSAGRRVAHLDLYRIESPDELDELGWTDFGAPDELVLIEWPERAGERMPTDHWLVELTVPTGLPLVRDVEVHRIGTPPELSAFPISVSTR